MAAAADDDWQLQAALQISAAEAAAAEAADSYAAERGDERKVKALLQVSAAESVTAADPHAADRGDAQELEAVRQASLRAWKKQKKQKKQEKQHVGEVIVLSSDDETAESGAEPAHFMPLPANQLGHDFGDES